MSPKTRKDSKKSRERLNTRAHDKNKVSNEDVDAWKSKNQVFKLAITVKNIYIKSSACARALSLIPKLVSCTGPPCFCCHHLVVTTMPLSIAIIW